MRLDVGVEPDADAEELSEATSQLREELLGRTEVAVGLG